MSYIEVVVSVTAFASVWNMVLQTNWYYWSKGIYERKHKEDV